MATPQVYSIRVGNEIFDVEADSEDAARQFATEQAKTPAGALPPMEPRTLEGLTPGTADQDGRPPTGDFVPPGLKDIARGVASGAKAVAKTASSPEVFVPTAMGTAGMLTAGPGGALGGAFLGGQIGRIMGLAEEKGHSMRDQADNLAKFGPIVGNAITLYKAVENPGDAIDIVAHGALDVVIEGVGLGIAKSLGALPTFSPLKAKIKPGIESAVRLIDERGGKLTVSQMTDAALWDRFEGIARAGYVSKTAMDTFDATNIVAMEKARSEMVRGMISGLREGASNEQIGLLLRNSVNMGRSAQRAIENTLYSEVDRITASVVRQVPVEKQIPTGLIGADGKPIMRTIKEFRDEMFGGAPVSLDSLKRHAADISKKAERLGGQTLFQIRAGGKSLEGWIGGVMGSEKRIGFMEAHSLRSTYLDAMRGIEDANARRLFKDFIGILDSSMNFAARGLSPEAARAWRKANNFTKSGRKVFETDFMASLLSDDIKYASDIGKSIYRSGNIEQIDMMEKALRRADGLNPGKKILEKGQGAMRLGFLEDMFSKNKVVDPKLPGGSVLNFDAIVRDMGKRETSETMRRLFGTKHIAEMATFMRAGQLVMQRPGTAGFGLVQAGAVAGGAFMLLSNPVGGLMSITSAMSLPMGMGVLVRSPRALKMATQGFKKMAEGSQRSVQVGTTALIRAFAEGTIDLLRDEGTRAFFESMVPTSTGRAGEPDPNLDLLDPL